MQRIPQMFLQAIGAPSEIVAALMVGVMALTLLDTAIARYRRPRVRLVRVEPVYQTDGGCYCDF